MNNIASVVYAYSPKNDDELELTVGDKIEVIGYEEEGWWKGRLQGRVGVFPSNFVEIVDSISTPTAQSIITSTNSSIASQQQQQTNKLGLFGGKTSKTNSSNSLNSNHSNSNNNIYNPNNSNKSSNNSSIMNNTQHQDNVNPCDDPSVASSGERRPKPIRNVVGYGDIFAAAAAAAAATGKSKPLASNPTGVATERLKTSITNALQKQIPKKPPPPAPDTSNGTSGHQAPALPPKPSNQYSPHLQHSRQPPPASQPASLAPHQTQSLHQPPLPSYPSGQPAKKRELARVIYAYEPKNQDELAMEKGDIITVLDKDIEDAGWWKGELRGKIGVFPDNFIELIESPDAPAQDNWSTEAPTPAATANKGSSPNLSATTPTAQQNSGVSESKALRSVFAGTPKGFSKELENNLEKQHNNPAAFLSLKRNRLQQQQTTNDSTTANEDSNGKRDEASAMTEASITSTSSPTKLNHITANRAKGPTRRPPSNFLNKRNQIDSMSSRQDTNGRGEESPSIGNALQHASLSSTVQKVANHDSLSSLPSAVLAHQQQQQQSASIIGSFPPKSNDNLPANSIKSSLSLDNVVDDHPNLTPKTSQRANQQPAAPVEKGSKTTVTPPWMVELRKAHAERKRDTPLVTGLAQDEETSPTKAAEAPSSPIASIQFGQQQTGANTNIANNNVGDSKTVVTPNFAAPIASTPSTATPTTATTTNSNVAAATTQRPIDVALLSQQISKNVTHEINELREEFKKLRDELAGVRELKEAVEVIKIELKACQSATENQKRYIKDLVTNLADERKKIAAMQSELERNLK